MLRLKECSTDDSLLSTPGFAKTPEPIFTPIKDLAASVSYYQPLDSPVLNEISNHKMAQVSASKSKKKSTESK